MSIISDGYWVIFLIIIDDNADFRFSISTVLEYGLDAAKLRQVHRQDNGHNSQ